MTQPSASLDDRLVQAMRSFDPSEAQTKRMRHAVLASHDTLHRPLTLEWIGVFRSRPVLNTTLVMAAAILLLITSPLGSAGWFAWKTLVATAQADGGDARIGLLAGGAHDRQSVGHDDAIVCPSQGLTERYAEGNEALEALAEAVRWLDVETRSGMCRVSLLHGPHIPDTTSSEL